MIRAAVVALLLGTASALAVSPLASAVPVDPAQRIRLEQPDGTSFTAKPFGDERYHGFETIGGFTVVRDPQSGFWEYADSGAAGRLEASGRRPGGGAPSGIAGHLRDRPAAERAAALARSSAPSARSASGSPQPPNLGTQPALVILTQFADQSSLGTTPLAWEQRYFGLPNSVRAYYDEVSGGEFAVGRAAETSGTDNSGVVGWITLSGNHPRTTQLGNSAQVERAQITARDAIQAASSFVDYDRFDTSGDGRVEPHELHVVVITAGWEASTGCGTPAVWAHQNGLESHTALVDGVIVENYMMFGEEHCDSDGSPPPRQATIGIMAHELGHDLDLPDLYDVDGSSNGGVGAWSLMSSGTWLSAPGGVMGSSPAHLDAFSKYYEGWVTPVQFFGGIRAEPLQQVETEQRVFQLQDNPNGVDWEFPTRSGTGEYYLLENREQVGYDVGLPGCGVLIWHIDETRTGTNLTNATDSRRLVQLVEADGDNDPFDAGDAWLGSRFFNESSTPNSRFYSGAVSGTAAANFGSSCGSSVNADLSAKLFNNSFADATQLSGTLATPIDTWNVAATKQPGEPNHAGNPGGASIWYRWTADRGGKVTLDTVGSDFDTLLGVYTGSTAGGLTEVASNDDAPGVRTSRLTFDATAGTTYRIAIDGYTTTPPTPTGRVRIRLEQAAPVRSDFNGDGYADLAVGVPGEDVGSASDAGGVHVLYGTAFGHPANNGVFLTQSSAGTGASEAGDGFGSAVTTGDFNADGVLGRRRGGAGRGQRLGVRLGRRERDLRRARRGRRLGQRHLRPGRRRRDDRGGRSLRRRARGRRLQPGQR